MKIFILAVSVVLYSKCFFAVLLGLIIHTGIKFQEVKKLYVTANESFTFKLFLKNAIASHVVNIASVLLWMLVLPDVITAWPQINGSVSLANIVHIGVCAAVGYANSSLILKALGSGTQYIMKRIDEKTNIADGKK